MIKHSIFPTLYGEWKFPDHEIFKQHFKETIFDYIRNNGTTKSVKGVGERTEHIGLHTIDSYSPIFRFASECVREYIRTMNIDDQLYDLSLVKSWLSVTGTPTNVHCHADAHVVFTYYINIPEDLKKNLRFHRKYNNINDLYYCMSEFNCKNKWNEFNCKTWEQPASEGDLFVFPGELTHDIVDSYRKETIVEAFNENELFQQRICLAGDFNLIYRESSSNATGTQPTKNWRMF
jgi:hypothetical protein